MVLQGVWNYYLSKGANINEYLSLNQSIILSCLQLRESTGDFNASGSYPLLITTYPFYIISATALAILSDEKQGLSALQFRCGNYKTPMRMLIQHMPSKIT